MSKERLDHPEFLVETDWLHQHLGDPDLRIFDCTVNNAINPDPVRGRMHPFVFENDRANFNEKHIPGAGYIDILGELSDLSADLPMMAPSEQQFAEAMGKHGVGADSLLVLYSTPGQWASRVWWMLRSFGFDNAVILSGGLPKWIAEGRPVSNDARTYAPGKFTAARSRGGAFVGKDDLLGAINDEDALIINALPAMMHSGESGSFFGRKGHIPGSVNLPFGALHDPDTDAYLPPEKLKGFFDAIDAGSAKRIIVYCGAGIGSTNDAFAMTMLGYQNVSVYDASLSEWGNDESLPMETG